MIPDRNRATGFGVALLLAGGLIFALPAGPAAGADAIKAKSIADLVTAAKKETTLRAQWSANTLDGGPGLQKIVAAMNKKYGLNIQPSFTPGPNMQGMMAKITREMLAGQPASSDVYFGNSQAMLQAMEHQPLISVDWRALLERKMLPPEPGFDPIVTGNTGVALASTLVGVIYNSNLVKGSDIPRKLDDLMSPKWKGKIASTPYAAGFREFAMPELLGKERIVNFVKKFSKHIAGLIRCGEMERLTSGEFLMLALSCGDQEVNIAERKGIPLGYSVLQDATISHTRYGAVPKNSRSPNSAALFVAFLHTPEGQKLMWDIDGLDFHLYPESNQKKKLDAAKAKGAKVVISSPQWLNKNKHYDATQKELEKILRGEAS